MYLNKYEINNFDRKIWPWEKVLVFSNPKYYLTQIYMLINPFLEKPKIDIYGYNSNNFDGRFKSIGYDEGTIFRSSKNHLKDRFKGRSLEVYEENCKLVIKMIELCKARRIEPIIVAPPVYKTYIFEMLGSKNERKNKFLNEIKTDYTGIKILDFENLKDTTSFFITDFKDDDHLNPHGAQKFTNMVNKCLN